MRSKKLAGVAACVIVVLAAAAVAAALGAFNSSTSSAGAAPAKTDAIKLHGAWTIEIRDQGRTVRKVRFHNDLNSAGAKSLVSFLARQNSVGQWMIGLTPQLCGTTAAPEYCWIDEGLGGTVAQTHTVVLSTPTSGPDSGKLVLTATMNAGIDNSITNVNTALNQCPATSAPATPCTGQGFGFSGRTLPTPIPVVAGQQVLITVKFSFS
jgi:hypothetical protein